VFLNLSLPAEVRIFQWNKVPAIESPLRIVYIYAFSPMQNQKKVPLSLPLFIILLSVYISNNCHGQEWAAMNSGLYGGNVRTLFAKGDIVFAGTEESGIFKSKNGGAWQPANKGLSNRTITSFCAAGDSLFAGTFQGGLHMSLDDGENWTTVHNSLSSVQITDLSISGPVILASTVTGIFKSTDVGKSWTASNTGLPTGIWINVI
jgi:hypothetical protein